MSLPCSFERTRSIDKVVFMTVAASSTRAAPGSFQQLSPVPIEAWYYNPVNEENPSEVDPAQPHQYKPNRAVSTEHLADLGVLTWTELETKNHQQNEFLEKIKLERGYNYEEEATVAPGKTAYYEENIQKFFMEHLHEHEEIRFILAGGGYEDIRDFDGQWIRIRIKEGDLIVLPRGMYHRFTLDKDYYVKALLLYKDNPCRIQFDRGPAADDMEVRKEYTTKILSRGGSLNVDALNLSSMLDDLASELAELKAQQGQVSEKIHRIKGRGKLHLHIDMEDPPESAADQQNCDPEAAVEHKTLDKRTSFSFLSVV